MYFWAAAAEVATIEWAEPVDGHWWDPLRWRDSATGAPRVPTASDHAHIATFANQTFSVFVDVRSPHFPHVVIK